MSVVAVRAFHRAFGDAVVNRQCKLCLDVSVTAEAQVRLLFLKEAVMQPAGLLRELRDGKEVGLRKTDLRPARIPRSLHQVRRMTFVAADSVLDMSGMREILLILAALMTLQAARRIL